MWMPVWALFGVAILVAFLGTATIFTLLGWSRAEGEAMQLRHRVKSLERAEADARPRFRT